MKTIEIVGFKRENLGTTTSKKLRNEGQIPCVLYGGKTHVHFSVPTILFKDLVYTPEVHTVDLNVEGSKYQCILQDIQFHPVSETILHVDFLLLQKGKHVKMDIPVRLVGSAPGVQKGGKLMAKLRKITIKSLPEHLPDFIDVDVSKLELGKSVKVGDLKQDKYTILNNSSIPVATVQIPRVVKEETPATAQEATATPEAKTEATKDTGKDKK